MKRARKPTGEPAHLALARHAARELEDLDRQIAAHGAPPNLAATYERVLVLGRQFQSGTLPTPLWQATCDIHAHLMRAIERWQGYAAPAATVIHVDFRAGRRAS